MHQVRASCLAAGLWGLQPLPTQPDLTAQFPQHPPSSQTLVSPWPAPVPPPPPSPQYLESPLLPFPFECVQTLPILQGFSSWIQNVQSLGTP